jgi:hypothetical protein
MRAGADINRILKNKKKSNLSIEKTNFEDHTAALIGSDNITAFLSRPRKKSERACGRRRYADFRVPLPEMRTNERVSNPWQAGAIALPALWV